MVGTDTKRIFFVLFPNMKLENLFLVDNYNRKQRPTLALKTYLIFKLWTSDTEDFNNI